VGLGRSRQRRLLGTGSPGEWIVLATAGPLLGLGLAQAAGERGFDGAAPLTSPSGISRLFWTALVLLLGFWLGSWAEERRVGSGLG
jgi:hypothetical protein